MRAIELVRGGWGAALLVAPRPVMERVHHVQVDTKSVVVVRILGARQLTQAVLSGRQPSPEVLAMGVWVDAVHALTALALAALDRPRARGGLLDAGVAGTWAAVGYRDLLRANSGAETPPDRRDRLARLVLRVAPGGWLLLRRVERTRVAQDRRGS